MDPRTKVKSALAEQSEAEVDVVSLPSPPLVKKLPMASALRNKGQHSTPLVGNCYSQLKHEGGLSSANQRPNIGRQYFNHNLRLGWVQ